MPEEFLKQIAELKKKEEVAHQVILETPKLVELVKASAAEHLKKEHKDGNPAKKPKAGGEPMAGAAADSDPMAVEADGTDGSRASVGAPGGSTTAATGSGSVTAADSRGPTAVHSRVDELVKEADKATPAALARESPPAKPKALLGGQKAGRKKKWRLVFRTNTTSYGPLMQLVEEQSGEEGADVMFVKENKLRTSHRSWPAWDGVGGRRDGGRQLQRRNGHPLEGPCSDSGGGGSDRCPVHARQVDQGDIELARAQPRAVVFCLSRDRRAAGQEEFADPQHGGGGDRGHRVRGAVGQRLAG